MKWRMEPSWAVGCALGALLGAVVYDVTDFEVVMGFVFGVVVTGFLNPIIFPED